MPRTAGNIDDATDSVLNGHLPTGPDGATEWADQVHLHRAWVKYHGGVIFVAAARCALDALDELGNALRVRRRYGPAGVVHQDVEAAVGSHDFGDEGIDRPVIALIADLLGGAGCPLRVDAGDAVQRRARTPNDRGAGA